MFDALKAGARLKGLDPAGIAEIVQGRAFWRRCSEPRVRVNGRVGERLVYRGEEAAFEFLEAGRAYGLDADGSCFASRRKPTASVSRTCSTPTWR